MTTTFQDFFLQILKARMSQVKDYMTRKVRHEVCEYWRPGTEELPVQGRTGPSLLGLAQM